MTLSVVALLGLFGTGALPISWDCFLPSGSVDCAQLEAAVFQASSLLERNSTAPARVLVRSVEFDGGTEYRITVMDGAAHVELVDRIPASFTDDVAGSATVDASGGGGGLGGGADTGGGGGSGTGGGTGRGRLRRSNVVLIRLVGSIQRAATPLLSLDRPTTLEDGVLVMRLRDPDLAAGQARVENRSVGWYLSPTLSGEVSQTALLRVQGRAQLDANWSTPRWRTFGTAAAGMTYLQAPAPQGEEPQSFGYATGLVEGAAAHAVWHGWSVGVTARAQHAPEQNLLFRGNLYTGLQWVLSPFLETSGTNLGVSYLVGAEHHEYVRPNVRVRFEENFLRHRIVAFSTWHSSRVDVTGSLSASSLLRDVTYSDVAAGLGVAWRVGNDLSLAGTGAASYRNALLNAPDNLNSLDPLERFVGGGNYGAINFSASVSLVYVLGNSVLVRQDQRFSNVLEP